MCACPSSLAAACWPCGHHCSCRRALQRLNAEAHAHRSAIPPQNKDLGPSSLAWPCFLREFPPSPRLALCTALLRHHGRRGRALSRHWREPPALCRVLLHCVPLARRRRGREGQVQVGPAPAQRCAAAGAGERGRDRARAGREVRGREREKAAMAERERENGHVFCSVSVFCPRPLLLLLFARTCAPFLALASSPRTRGRIAFARRCAAAACRRPCAAAAACGVSRGRVSDPSGIDALCLQKCAHASRTMPCQERRPECCVSVDR